jgi:hypothetical protein
MGHGPDDDPPTTLEVGLDAINSRLYQWRDLHCGLGDPVVRTLLALGARGGNGAGSA